MTPSIRSVSPACIATLRLTWGKITAGATNHLFVKSECEGSKTQSGTFYLYGRVNVSVYGPYNQIFITKYSDYSERQKVNATLIDMK